MSGDPIDLDAIEERASGALGAIEVASDWTTEEELVVRLLVANDVPSLISEVRRLRATP